MLNKTRGPAAAASAGTNTTLRKGLLLLELLARSDGPLGVTEIAQRAGLPKSGAHRLLRTLADERFVTQQASGRYAASIKLWELGSAVLSGLDVRRHAMDLMESLVQTTGESVHLSVLDRYEVVYVHKVDGPDPVRAYTQIGGRAPAHCVATGKAMLAFKSAPWLAQAIAHFQNKSPRPLADAARFEAELAAVKRSGFASNRGQWRATVNGLAAPVFDVSGQAVAALGISGPESRLSMRRMRLLAPLVMEAAQRLSVGLGEPGRDARLLRTMSDWRHDAAPAPAPAPTDRRRA